MTAPDRADRIRDIIAVYEIVKATPDLPPPFTGPDRAAFYFIDARPDEAREAVAMAKRVLSETFGAVFGYQDVWTSNGTRRQYEAALPSGLKVVLTAKAEHMRDEDGAGARELAAVA